MLKVWQGGLATIVVTLLTWAGIVLDLSDGTFRQWWSPRAFTTDTLAGILAVLITVLIVNQVVGIRQQRQRFRATEAQTSMVLSQAIRATRAVMAGATSGDRTAEERTATGTEESSSTHNGVQSVTGVRTRSRPWADRRGCVRAALAGQLPTCDRIYPKITLKVIRLCSATIGLVETAVRERGLRMGLTRLKCLV